MSSEIDRGGIKTPEDRAGGTRSSTEDNREKTDTHLDQDKTSTRWKTHNGIRKTTKHQS